MPAKSTKQQRLMGMVHAAQTGQLKSPSEKVSKLAKSMTKKSASDFASTKHKGLPKKVKKKSIKENMDYENKVGQLYMVQKPSAGCDMAGMVYEVDPITGIQQHGVDAQTVHGMYPTPEEAQKVAEKLYNGHMSEMKKLEEKKGTVANKLTTAISKLEKKHKGLMETAKANPAQASNHKAAIAEIQTKIQELMDKLSMVEKSKKPIEEKEEDGKQADLAEHAAINERVDMDTLSDELKQLIKKYPGEKISYSFITNKDYPKGYVFYKNGKIIKETLKESAIESDIKSTLPGLDINVRQGKDSSVLTYGRGEPLSNKQIELLKTKYEVYEHEDESDDRGSSYYYTIKEKVSESINERLIGINPELVKKVKNFVNGIAKLYGYGTSDAIYNINAVLEFLKKESIDETQDKSYKVDDIVVVNKGPHKGIKHKIIHVSGDGKYNIKPILPPGSKNQYRLGASSATANDFEN